MRWIVGSIAVGILALSASANAQTATATSKFQIDIVAADAATAQAYTWRVYDDGGATGRVLTGGTCVASGLVITCTFPMPAYTPGAHSVQITAANAAGESGKSAAFSFTLVAVPNTPTNGRVLP